jgi:nicotinamide mononucleotide adenylyltransferase
MLLEYQKRFWKGLVCVLFTAISVHITSIGAQAKTTCPPPFTEAVIVERVLAADLLRLRDGRQVKLAGTATASAQAATQTQHYLDQTVAGKTIKLRPVLAADRWGRIVAHIEDESGNDIETHLINQGLAHVAAIERGSCTAALLQHEAAARRAHLGLWQNKEYVRKAQLSTQMVADTGHHILAAGTVVSARMIGNRMYINFAQRWQSALSLSVTRKDAGQAGVDIEHPAALIGQTIVVRGFVEWRYGPSISLQPQEPIEIIPSASLGGAPLP